MDSNTTQVPTQEPARSERKAYNTPALTDFGSFAEITQGGFTGVGADNGAYT